MATRIQTAGGKVDIRDIRFALERGATMSALLNVPESSSAENPAPVVLAVYGYINSRETQLPGESAGFPC